LGNKLPKAYYGTLSVIVGIFHIAGIGDCESFKTPDAVLTRVKGVGVLPERLPNCAWCGVSSAGGQRCLVCRNPDNNHIRMIAVCGVITRPGPRGIMRNSAVHSLSLLSRAHAPLRTFPSRENSFSAPRASAPSFMGIINGSFLALVNNTKRSVSFGSGAIRGPVSGELRQRRSS